MKGFSLPLGLGAFALITACSATPVVEPSKPSVAATIYPLAFVAQQVGGEFISVQQITPGGIEPHDYEPGARQIATIHRSKVFMMNGGGIDAWADKIIAELKNEGITTLRMTDVVDQENNDPHFWLDPVLMQKEVTLIRDALMTASPAQAKIYKDNATKLTSQFSALDKEFRYVLSQCKTKQIMVSHDAFGYLAKRYGFETLAIAGISPDEEPSAKRLSELADFAKEKGITHIFFETLVSPKLAETIAEEIGAQALVLNPLEGLTEEDVNAGKDYFSIMRENLQNLRTAMECK